MALERLPGQSLKGLVRSADEAAALITDGMTVGTSGFTPSGYPKAVPKALAERYEGRADKPRLTLIAGASVGDELDGALARAGMIARRYPYQTNEACRDGINAGSIAFDDIHISHLPQRIDYGFFGPIDVAILEAAALYDDGSLVPTTSVGISPTLAANARSIIVELNAAMPRELEGLHDIYRPSRPPERTPIPLVRASDRIGEPFIRLDPARISAVVLTELGDDVRPLAPVGSSHARMAENFLAFLDEEIAAGRMPEGLLPLQSGVGSVANAVLAGFLHSRHRGLRIYSEVIQDSILDLLDSGVVSFVSGCSVTPSPDGLRRFLGGLEGYKRRMTLRPQEISNHPEIIRRLGIVSMNTALEVDLFGNVNSTTVMGRRMMNGIGGSGDFTRNAYLSVFFTESTAKRGAVSSVVPYVSHVDHTSHDVDVIVSEHGVADLRGLCPTERALAMIREVAHPDYREALGDYLREARGGEACHQPLDLRRAFDFHLRYQETGSMLAHR